MTDRAHGLLRDARARAVRIGHRQVGTEHVLLALFELPSSELPRGFAELTWPVSPRSLRRSPRTTVVRSRRLI
ncbi:Clp protease N-terminal domain-containing protein [Nitriliruptor sp.]|uniref:Clp protease N-terminal domain-containing protein n=1 Tax=Nitriliruptor sp. TaxID=2448056 RepID=UPI0034A01234